MNRVAVGENVFIACVGARITHESRCVLGAVNESPELTRQALSLTVEVDKPEMGNLETDDRVQ